jgi:hypothetical protein
MPFQLKSSLNKCLINTRSSARNVVRDITEGFFNISHNSFAMLGLVLVFVLIMLTARPDLREAGESRLMALLLERQEASIGFTEPGAVDRATAVNPNDLPSKQAAVALWLSKKYNVAPEPTLILAIMAIESGFNPFAQSPVGAQGLMQVMTGIHRDKYAHFGGKLAAFDPVTNLRVGVKVLEECIARAGSIEGGLKFYVGAANLDSDGGYTVKVMEERGRLQAVASGKRQAYEGQATPVMVPASFPLSPRPANPSPANDSQSVALLDS